MDTLLIQTAAKSQANVTGVWLKQTRATRKLRKQSFPLPLKTFFGCVHVCCLYIPILGVPVTVSPSDLACCCPVIISWRFHSPPYFFTLSMSLFQCPAACQTLPWKGLAFPFSTSASHLCNIVCFFSFFSDSSLHSKETSSIEPGSETALQSGGSPTPPPTLSMVELFNQRRQKLMQRKFQIAELSSSILENPQENVS